MRARIPISKPDPPALFCCTCRKWIAVPLATVLKTGLTPWECPSCTQGGLSAQAKAKDT